MLPVGSSLCATRTMRSLLAGLRSLQHKPLIITSMVEREILNNIEYVNRGKKYNSK